jgi:lipopolysaccharide exporter
VGLLRGLGVSGILVAGAPAIAALFAEPRAVNILRLLALKPVLDAAASIRTAELVRHLQYRRLAWVSLPAVVVETAVSLALASTLGVWALVWGALAGGVVGVTSSYVAAPHRPRLSLQRRAIRPLVHYGRWIFLTGIVSVSASSLTQVVISRQLGALELGLYFLATRLAMLPYEFAGHVVSEVAFPMYASIQDEPARVTRAFRSILVGIGTLVLPLYVLLIALAPWVVHDVLGARWAGTEPLIQVLALVGVIGLFGDACGPLFRGLGYPNWTLVIEFVQSGLVIALVWSFTSRYGAAGAALAWLVAVACTQVLNFALARRLVRHPLAGAAVPLLVVGAASLAGAAAAGAVGYVVSGLVGLVIASGVAAGVTALVVWWCDTRFNLGIVTVLVHTFPQIAALVGLVARR